MSRHIGDRLPARLQETFNGEDLERKSAHAYLLVTSDPDGVPRPCMLSVGEILVVDDQTIRLALWSGSHTDDNLGRGSDALLCFWAPETVLYVKGSSRSLGRSGEHDVECFEIRVQSVESDAHPAMPVTDTISIKVEDPRRAIVEWAKKHETLRRPRRDDG